MSPGSRLLLACGEDGQPLGMLTLVLFRVPTDVRAWIEDVVVDHGAREQGVGGLLVHHAIGIAREAGARTVDLTSRPGREAANALYVREGFKLRDSNVYRVTLCSGDGCCSRDCEHQVARRSGAGLAQAHRRVLLIDRADIDGLKHPGEVRQAPDWVAPHRCDDHAGSTGGDFGLLRPSTSI